MVPFRSGPSAIEVTFLSGRNCDFSIGHRHSRHPLRKRHSAQAQGESGKWPDRGSDGSAGSAIAIAVIAAWRFCGRFSGFGGGCRSHGTSGWSSRSPSTQRWRFWRRSGGCGGGCHSGRWRGWRSKIRDPKARADVEDNFRKTVGQVLGGAAVLIGAGAAYLQFTQQQQSTHHDLLISNQVSKGFEQLAGTETAMRLGGIYALEGVMNTSEQSIACRCLKPSAPLCAIARHGTQ